MQKLVISNDIRKLVAIAVSYLLIAIIIVALAIVREAGPVVIGIAVVVAAALLFGFVSMINKMRDHSPLFAFDEDGVTDYTKADDIITLPWEQVIGVQLKAANNNDLVLDIYGFKTADQLDVVTPAMEAQMKDSEGKVYYCLELSGLWVRRARIREAFDWLQANASKRNPEIKFGDFDDPLSQLGGKKSSSSDAGTRS